MWSDMKSVSSDEEAQVCLNAEPGVCYLTAKWGRNKQPLDYLFIIPDQVFQIYGHM